MRPGTRQDSYFEGDGHGTYCGDNLTGVEDLLDYDPADVEIYIILDDLPPRSPGQPGGAGGRQVLHDHRRALWGARKGRGFDQG